MTGALRRKDSSGIGCEDTKANRGVFCRTVTEAQKGAGKWENGIRGACEARPLKN